MMVFREKGRARWDVKVPSSSGRWTKRSTGTSDRVTAKNMQRMIDELGAARSWDLLDRVSSSPPTLTVPVLYDAWANGDLDGLRARLQDVDLASYIPAWLKDVRSRGVKQDTIDHYELHVRSLIGTLDEEERPAVYLRSALSREAIMTWLAERDVATGTRRKYHAAMSSFLGYLTAISVIPANLMRTIKAPKAGKPRDRHLSTADAIRLADAQEGAYRVFSVLLAGTGVDVSTALLLTRRDVDVERHEIRARGTKTHNRDRVVKVASWAWSYIERHVQELLPDARLFDFDRWEAGESHRDACKALKMKDYWMRDARHTWAVRWAKAGGPAQQGALQLGHKDATLFLKVYGIYYPTSVERDHWEAVATARDTATTTPQSSTRRKRA